MKSFLRKTAQIRNYLTTQLNDYHFSLFLITLCMSIFFIRIRCLNEIKFKADPKCPQIKLYNFQLNISHLCNIWCRFNGEDMLRRVKGKRILFVGDSLSFNQWQSLTCMLHTAVPQSNYTIDDSSFSLPVSFLQAYMSTISTLKELWAFMKAISYTFQLLGSLKY